MATVVAVAGAWLLVVVLAAVFQRQLIYLPDTSTPRPPDDVETVSIMTADGLELTAWFLTADAPFSTVLVAPGNAGHRELRLPLARGLVDRGHAVMLLDYRGYGGNPGSPSAAGLIADVRAAREHLVRRSDVDATRLVYLGESIGSSVVAALAAESPPATLVLRSPFPELADIGRSAYPFLPVRLLLRDRHPVVEHLEGYGGPVLVVAGGADRIVPAEYSVEVAEAVDAELVLIPDADHNDPALLAGEQYLDTVDIHVRDAISERRNSERSQPES